MTDLNPVTSLDIDTSGLAAKDQFAYCRDGLFESTGIVIERDCPSDAPFHLKIRLHQSSGIMVSKYDFAMPSTLKRTHQSMARTDQDFICIHYRTRGDDLDCSFRGGENRTHSGDVRIHDLTQQYVVNNPHLVGYTLYLDRSILLDHLPDVSHLHGSLLRGSAITEVFKTALVSVYRQYAHANACEAASLSATIAALATDAVKLQMIQDLESCEIGQVSVLSAVISHIKQNYHRRDCTPGSIARAVGVSRAKLYRICKPYETPMDLVRQIRLKRAAELLSTTSNANISGLADRVGFSGRQSFTRAFTAAYDVSPRDYRSLMRASAGPGISKTQATGCTWQRLEAAYKAAHIA